MLANEQKEVNHDNFNDDLRNFTLAMVVVNSTSARSFILVGIISIEILAIVFSVITVTLIYSHDLW
jgi:hypothetical protein